MKVYIYKPHKERFQDDWLFAADTGFNALCAKVKYFEDVNSIPYEPDTIVVGYVEDTMKYMDMHNIKYPKPLNIPTELKSFKYRLGRNMTFSEAKQLPGETLFIKPVSKVKQFSSGVVKISSLSNLIDIPDDEIVYVGWPVEMLSEYRCFVYKGEVVGIKHYQGDFSLFPNFDHIIKMVYEYKSAPIAYTLDVAIQKHKTYNDGTVTSIVECNDFWSIAHYGLDPVIYAKMLRDRWFQMAKFRTFNENDN